MDTRLAHIDVLKTKYPGATAWGFGDSPALADELASLVVRGIKTATCSSLHAFKNSEDSPVPGDYSIILNGQHAPVCVIRLLSLQLIRFTDVTDDFARKEGEGDLSLAYWRSAHKDFFMREGSYSEDMELIAEQFELIEIV